MAQSDREWHWKSTPEATPKDAVSVSAAIAGCNVDRVVEIAGGCFNVPFGDRMDGLTAIGRNWPGITVIEDDTLDPRPVPMGAFVLTLARPSA